MRKSIILGVIGVMTAATLGLSGAAAATPSGTGSASDVVRALKAQGYNVMLNGTVDEPLSSCTVTGIDNPDRTGHAAGLTTVYVDVSCSIGN